MNSLSIAKSLIEMAESGISYADISKNLMAEARDKNALYVIPFVVSHMERILKQQEDQKRVLVNIPFDSNVTEDMIQKIKILINAPKDAPVKIHRDKEILAGFSAQYKGIFYDAGAKKKLENLKDSITKK